MNDGKRLEQYLDRQHSLARRAGKACIFKVPNPVAGFTVKRGKVSGKPGPAVYVDYAGVLALGIGVAIEAKLITTKGPSFPMSRVKRHQHETMTLVDSLGGVSGLYIRHVMPHEEWTPRLPPASDYFVPISYVDAVTARSLRWEKIDKYRVPTGKQWLDAVTWWHAYQFKGWDGL